MSDQTNEKTKKYKSLNVNQKRDLIAAVEGGEKLKNVAQNFGVAYSTACQILKSKDKILSISGSGVAIRKKNLNLIQWTQQWLSGLHKCARSISRSMVTCCEQRH